MNISIYRVILFIRHWDGGCCGHNLGVMRSRKGLECALKTGRKLLLGKKSTVMVIVMSQAGGLQKEQILDLVI